MRHIKPAYTKFDPAHTMDGVWVPTRGKERKKLLVPMRKFGEVLIGFQGTSQLGGNDQSIMYAISAQLGIDGLMIDAEPNGPISKQLRLALNFSEDKGYPIASKRTSLRSLLIDAGYKDPESGRALEDAKNCLNRLRNAQIREIDLSTGWDRVCNLISASFNHNTGAIYIAANPRLTKAVFHGQHIKISLFERNLLKSEVSKILHSWLCSNIRLGKELGLGNGVKIDTLAPHVWGPEWEGYSRQSKSQKRGQLRDALVEIADKTKKLHNGYGWNIDQTTSGIVMVSRPKTIPVNEEIFSYPSQLDEEEKALKDFIYERSR